MKDLNPKEDLAALHADPELQQLEIMRVTEPLLKNGERWLINKDEEGTVVATLAGPDDTDQRSVLQQTHPRLYGALLSANERVNDSFSCGLMLVGLLSILLPCLGLHWQLFHHLTEDVKTERLLEQLRNGWVYGIVGLIGLTFWIKVSGWIEALAYQTERAGLAREASQAGLDRLEIVGLVEGDASVSVIAKRLKVDPGSLV